jgi:MFS family permease
MLKHGFLSNQKLPVRDLAASFILIVNAFVWYLFAFNIMMEIIRAAGLAHFEVLAMLAVNFVAAAVFALTGAVVVGKIGKRVPFLLVWMLVGIVSSFIPMLLNTLIETNIFIIAFLFGAAFGLGMPSSMGYFADSTDVSNRAKLGGIVFFSIGLAAFLLGMMNVTETITGFWILTIWRAAGMIAFFSIRPRENLSGEKKSFSYVSIINQRSFLLYFIPWIMFCLVNQTSAPVLNEFFGETFFTLLTAIEATLAGSFAIVSGFFCDRIGRRRVAIFGFIVLGVGYATLGILPQEMISWYLYTVADGVAWGIFYSVFFTTIWGDLAGNAPSDKYYALGGLPYLLSNFLRFVLGQYIAETIAIYTIFSLASFFLFLAVIPLMYAPETLPEKRIRDIELEQYIEQAKKTKEKYA